MGYNRKNKNWKCLDHIEVLTAEVSRLQKKLDSIQELLDIMGIKESFNDIYWRCTMGTKFKGEKPEGGQVYDYAGVNFFRGDKDNLIEKLNDAEVPYSSFSHFVRASINTQLEKLNIDFHITER